MIEVLTKLGLRQPAPPAPPPAGKELMTDTELHRLVNDGRVLAELANQPAFSLFRERVLSEAGKRKDKLVDMSAEDLTGHKGVAEQNFIRGLVSALTEVAVGCVDGIEAQKVLAEREAKKPA